MLWEVSPSSPKYVAPCGHWLFWSKKCHRAALISPSKRQKRHRGPDRPKIRPFLRVASPNFLNSQSPLAKPPVKDTKTFLSDSFFGQSTIPGDFQFGSWGEVWAVLKLSTVLSPREKYQCLSKSGEGFIFVCLRPPNAAQSPEASAQLGRDQTSWNSVFWFLSKLSWNKNTCDLSKENFPAFSWCPGITFTIPKRTLLSKQSRNEKVRSADYKKNANIQGDFLTVPPNFQYQNEKRWAANQRFRSMKFSMYKRSPLVEHRFSF